MSCLAYAGEVDVGVDAVELGLDPGELRAVVVEGQGADDAQGDALLLAGRDDAERLVFEDLGQIGIGPTDADLLADLAGRTRCFVTHTLLPSRSVAGCRAHGAC